jgi:protein TIF31
VVPTIAADSPSVFPPLPVEDESWGGNGGGQGRLGVNDTRPWMRDFAILAALPCKTVEERQVRDRKAFLLHSLFVDVAIVKAVTVVRRVGASLSSPLQQHEELHGSLQITVTRDVANAAKKIPAKIDGCAVPSFKDLAEKNLLKGITADENTTVHVCSSILTLIILPVKSVPNARGCTWNQSTMYACVCI